MEAGLFTTRPARRFRLGLGGAFLISLLIHVLLVAWIQFGGASRLFLAPIRESTLVPASQGKKSPVESLQFTFVDVPNDQPAAESPRARLFSDKTRVARQAVPTPPNATNLGPDPHSVGNSRLRQLARSGPPARPTAAMPPPSPAREASRGARAPAGGPNGLGTAQPGQGGDRTEVPDLKAQGAETREDSGSGFQGKREAFQKALKQLESGTYDFSNFDNPAYLQGGGNYGTLSFDTKGFDWGDYARQLYLIIKKNWYDRIPIAAYYGQKGKVFIRFVIEKDGTISDLAILRSSDISPFDLAAENAIRASNPLPHLPSNFPKEREGVTFGFYYNLPIDGQ